MGSHIVLSLALLPALFPLPLDGEMMNRPGPGYSSYKPFSSLPYLTGQASPPINIPVVQEEEVPSGDSQRTPRPFPTFTFTITGSDMDTYITAGSGMTREVADPSLACVLVSGNWPTTLSFSSHTTNTEPVTVWNVVAESVRLSKASRTVSQPTRIYHNVYAVYNKSVKHSSRQTHDVPTTFVQLLILPGMSGSVANAEPATMASPPMKRWTGPKIPKNEDDEILNSNSRWRDRAALSSKLRAKLEKRLTKEQQNALAEGNYIALKLGGLPTDLQKQAREYVTKSVLLWRGSIPTPDDPQWENFTIRFLPSNAGEFSAVLGVMTIMAGGTEQYF